MQRRSSAGGLATARFNGDCVRVLADLAVGLLLGQLGGSMGTRGGPGWLMLERLRVFRAQRDQPAPASVLLWDQPITVFALLLALARRRRTLAYTMVVFGLLGLLASWLGPPWYQSSFTIVPPPRMANRHMDHSFAELFGALNSDGEGFTEGGSDTYWLDTLTRNSVLDRVITSQNLMRQYHAKTLASAERTLRSHVGVSADEGRLLNVVVNDRNPKRAFELAEALLASLQQELNELAVTDSRARLAAYEQAAANQQARLQAAEAALVATQMRTGAIVVGAQAGQSLQQIAQLRATISADQILLRTMAEGRTEQAPEVERLHAKLTADQSALNAAEASGVDSRIGVTPATDAPESARAIMDALHNVEQNQALYDALGRQLNDARTEAAVQAPLLQLVERPNLPDHTVGLTWPVLLFVFLILGLFLGCILALVRQVALDYAVTPEGAARVAALRALLGRKHPQAPQIAG